MRGLLLVTGVMGLSLLGSARVGADGGNGIPAVEDGRSELAEGILSARESAMGRSFDPLFRRVLAARLSALPAAEFQSLDGPLPNALGQSSADLVYTPVPPCRVFDTRVTSAIMVAGVARNFLVAGTNGFPDQGGTTGGCGIPMGPATSVMMNFTVVDPTGRGNLRAWAVANPQPAVPNASIVNFSSAIPSALANGIAVPICDPAATTCTADIRLQAFVSNVHVVGDVVGYFKAPVRPTVITLSDAQGSTTSTTFTAIASMWAGVNNGSSGRLLHLGYTRARLVARFDNLAQTPACTTGPMTIRLTAPNLPPNPLVLATITDEFCGSRAWYLVSAPFNIPDTSAYDVEVRVAAGTGTWRWIGLEVW